VSDTAPAAGSVVEALEADPWAVAGHAASRWGPVVLLPAIFGAMVWYTWGKWPDVLVDFGHELYVPWQLSLGKSLGGDIAWPGTGPLSPYLNSFLFRLVGVSLRALVVFNLVLLAALTWLLYAILASLSDRLSATLAGVVFLTVFAFGQYVGIGNYNYVTPYSHGLTHGLVLSLGSIFLTYRCAQTRRPAWLGASTLAVGLVVLTKPEVFVAGALALAIPWLILLRDAWTRGHAARFVLWLATPAVLPALGTCLLLGLRLPAHLAWEVTLAPWLLLGARPVQQSPFYVQGLGLDRPVENLGLLLLWLGFCALAFVPTAVIDLRMGRRAGGAAISGAAAFLLTLVALVTLVPRDAWFGVARPLPVIVLVGALGYLSLLAGNRQQIRPCPRVLLGVMMTVFAGGLLLKMALNARLYHYGFVLAMPATLLVVTWLTGSVPALLRKRGGSGLLFRGVALATVLAVVLVHVEATSRAYARKVHPVGSGADAFLADGRGAFVAEMIRRIERVAQPGATLAVLPEGVMINYLTRRANPTPYVGFLSDASTFFGSEAPLVEAYRRSPPDLILLVHRDSSEHGARFFGQDYAREMMQWIEQNYEPVSLLGAPPFTSDRYGMLLFARRASHQTDPMSTRGPSPAPR
jgi:hypothetical protein